MIDWKAEATNAEIAVACVTSGMRVFGKTLRERAELLVGIAHPDFRVELRQAFAAVRHVVLPGTPFA